MYYSVNLMFNNCYSKSTNLMINIVSLQLLVKWIRYKYYVVLLFFLYISF